MSANSSKIYFIENNLLISFEKAFNHVSTMSTIGENVENEWRNQALAVTSF